MYPHGTIYQSGKSRLSAEIKLRPSLAKKFTYHLLRGFGAGLAAFGIVAIIFSFWPIVKEEISYRFGTSDQAQIDSASSLIDKSDAISLGMDPYFSIYVPKIEAKARIIPNVDAGRPTDYLWALQEGVAHARGTDFPGTGKNIFLFAHSTDSPLNFARYNAVFYLLGKLERGDRIVIFFLSKKYEYAVEDKVTTSATDTSWLNDDGSGERLILQTCDPPGTSWRRLLIIARPITGLNN